VRNHYRSRLLQTQTVRVYPLSTTLQPAHLPCLNTISSKAPSSPLQGYHSIQGVHTRTSTSVITSVTSRNTRSFPSSTSPGGFLRFHLEVRWMASWLRLRYLT